MPISSLELDAALKRLRIEGGPANRLVVESPGGWIAVWGPRDADEWTVVVSAGRQMPEGVRLSAERAQILYDQGFRQRTAAAPYRQTISAGPLAAHVLSLFDEVLETPADSFEVRLGDAPTVENLTVIERMRTLAADRSPRARTRLYHGLVKANLLVATEQMPGDVNTPLRVFGKLGTLPVVAAYTDWEAATAHDARGPHVLPMNGIDLFPLLVARKVGSLLINPAGPVGGELYKNELWSVAEGCKRLSAVH